MVVKKLKSYYQKMSAPVKASLWFTVSSVIQRGIALLSTPIFTRLLTTEQYGVYSVYQSWYSIIIIFTTLNLYAGVYNNGMTKWPEDRPQYTSSLLGLSTVITGIWFVVYIVAQDFWNQLFKLSSLFMYTIFIEALFTPAFSFWSAGQRYDYKYTRLVIVSVGMGLVSPLLGIVAVISTSYKAEARVLSYALVQIIVGLFFYIYLAYKGKKLYKSKYWKFALSFNLPLIPHYLAQTVLNQSDRIMIARMEGESFAAIYSVAYVISMMFTIVTTAINNSFIPYTYKAIRDEKIDSLKRAASFLVILVAAACLIAMAFGPEIIRIFAAKEYYDARWIVPPVAEALLFMFIYPLFCNVEFYYEQTKYIMIASGLAAAANVGLNYIFIQRFGYIAAAYTTLVCYILLAVVHYIAYKRISKKHSIKASFYQEKVILIISIVSILFMFGMTLIYDIWYIRYSVIILITILMLLNRKTIISKLREIGSKNDK